MRVRDETGAGVGRAERVEKISIFKKGKIEGTREIKRSDACDFSREVGALRHFRIGQADDFVETERRSSAGKYGFGHISFDAACAAVAQTAFVRNSSRR